MEKIGRAKWNDVCSEVENNNESIWINGCHSFHGLNDQIGIHDLGGVSSSLRLIAPESVLLRVQAEQAAFGDKGLRVRAYFEFLGENYAFTVTDPVIQAEYVGAGAGVYDLGPVALCISLSEPLKGFVYKLVAGIVYEDRIERAV